MYVYVCMCLGLLRPVLLPTRVLPQPFNDDGVLPAGRPSPVLRRLYVRVRLRPLAAWLRPLIARLRPLAAML